jgi:transposase
MLRREHGLQVGKNRVYALMKQEGLVLAKRRL